MSFLPPVDTINDAIGLLRAVIDVERVTGILEEMQKRVNDAGKLFVDAQAAQRDIDLRSGELANERIAFESARDRAGAEHQKKIVDLNNEAERLKAQTDLVVHDREALEARAQEVDKWERATVVRLQNASEREQVLNKREADLIEREARVKDLAETIAPIAAKLGVKI
jgi:chromosome segregation ATPase